MMKFRFLLLTILLVNFLQFNPPPVLAATNINVTTTTDELTTNGQCSLREAITLVNGGSAPDCGVLGTAPHTINIPAGTYTITIGNTWEDANLNGDFDVTTTDEVIFLGADPTTTIIQASTVAPAYNGDPPNPGQADYRVFQTVGPVTFANVMVRHGNRLNNSDAGGGINSFDTITLNNVDVSYNVADQGGGGINASEVIIQDSNFSYNGSGSLGGSAVFAGIATIDNSTFSNNQTDGILGGALLTGGMHITDSVFDNNYSETLAGAIAYDSTSLSIDTNSSIDNTTFTNNYAESTGAVWITTNSADTVTISNSVFDQNECFGSGGAIFVAGNTIIDSNTFTNNTCWYGDHLALGDDGFLGNIIVRNNTFTNNQGTSLAQAIEVNFMFDTSLVTIEDSTITHNETGVVFESPDGQLVLNGITFDNVAQPIVIGFSSNVVKVINSTISNWSDGAIDNRGVLELINVTISGTDVSPAIRNEGAMTLSNTIVTNTTSASCDLVSGTFTDGGGNLEYPGTSCGFSGALNDGTNDPLLLPLADNGGPTQTMALSSGSPAIDGTGETCPVEVNGVDQRGYARDSNCDIGAYEYDASLPPSNLVVTTTVDELATNGQCSLREAITLVNGGSASDCGTLGTAPHTITIPAGTYTITIGNTWEDANLDGDFDVTTTDEVIFLGADPTTTIIQASTVAPAYPSNPPNPGQADYRVFHIVTTPNTTFSNLTIRHGSVLVIGDSGGGIQGNYITLNNVDVSYNISEFGGGGIFANEVVIQDSTFTHNSDRSWGGSAVSANKVTVNNSSFLNNVNSLENLLGGTLLTAEMQISDSLFENNSGADQGGAIFYISDGTYASGDGISNSFIDNTVFRNNSAEVTGAVYLVTDATDIPVISNSTFEQNNCDIAGGAVFIIGNAQLKTNTFTDNTCMTGSSLIMGGGLGFDSNITVSDSTFSGGLSNSELVYVSADPPDTGSLTVTIKNSEFTNLAGVGIFNELGNTVIVEKSTFYQVDQPIVNLNNSTVKLINNTITENTINQYAIRNEGHLEIINSTIANNAMDGGESAIYNEGDITLTNSIVANSTGTNCDLTAGGTGTFTDGEGNLEYPGTSCGFSGALNDGTHDPILQPLADNGGPTQTMALDIGSPAIDGTGTTCPAEVGGVDQRGEPRSPICDIGAYEYGSAEPTNDALVLFDPATSATSYHFSVLDNPDMFDFTNTPPTNTAPEWVMGDWDGDGAKTPGYFDSGAFRYTNDIGATTNWSNGWWFGFASTQVGIVSGRFDPAFNNDCFGLIDANVNGGTGDLRFSLKYWCDMTVRPQDPDGGPLLKQWHGSPLPDSGNFTGTHQWVYGDWDNDGLDEPAVRRGGFINRSENAPSEGAATYGTGAQRWDTADGDGPGAHGLNDGLFVAGDWNGDGVDTWGVVYDDDTFYYRDVFGFNPGPFAFSSQTFTSSIATPRQVDSHPNAVGGSNPPAPAGPVNPVVVAQEPTLPPTQIPATNTPVPTALPPTNTPAPTSTPISLGVPPTATDVPPTDTPVPTATSEPSLTPIVIEPTATHTPEPTTTAIPPTATDTPLPTATAMPDPVRLPIMEFMDDGASHWLATGSWTLTKSASYHPDGLGWQATYTDDQSTLQFYAPIILGNVPYPNLRFQSNLQATHSTAQVEISLDAQTWLVVGVIQPGEGWVEQSIDLRDYRSMTIYLRFNWVSSEVPTGQATDGWLVDEVDLRNHPLEDPTATPESTETIPTDVPGGGSIGTGTQPTAEPPAPTPVPGVTQIGVGH